MPPKVITKEVVSCISEKDALVILLTCSFIDVTRRLFIQDGYGAFVRRLLAKSYDVSHCLGINILRDVYKPKTHVKMDSMNNMQYGFVYGLPPKDEIVCHIGGLQSKHHYSGPVNPEVLKKSIPIFKSWLRKFRKTLGIGNVYILFSRYNEEIKEVLKTLPSTVFVVVQEKGKEL